MNEKQYQQVYRFAAKLEELAENIDKVVGAVVDKSIIVTNLIDNYAENLRTEADKNAAGKVWESVSDTTEKSTDEPDTFRINITGLTPEEIAAEVRRIMNDIGAKQAGSVKNVDDLINDIFKKDTKEEE